MKLFVTDSAQTAYDHTRAHDAPTAAAFDLLWGRFSLDPAHEGTPLPLGPSADPQAQRIVRALARLGPLPTGAFRVLYEPIAGPASPPPWLAFAVVGPYQGGFALIALGRVNRQDRLV